MDGAADREQSERRWRAAQNLLDGVADEFAEQRLKRRRRILNLIGFGAVLVVLLGLVAYVAIGGHRSGAPVPWPSVPRWRLDLSVLLQVVGLATGVVGLVRTRRATRAGGAGKRWPTEVLARSERRNLIKELGGQLPAVPEHLSLARDFAFRRTRLSAGRLVMFGGVLLMVGQVVAGGSSTFTLPAALWSGLGVLSVLVMTRDLRRARRFLDQHPVPQSLEPAVPA